MLKFALILLASFAAVELLHARNIGLESQQAVATVAPTVANATETAKGATPAATGSEVSLNAESAFAEPVMGGQRSKRSVTPTEQKHVQQRAFVGSIPWTN